MFTQAVLEYARKLTARVYPHDAGGIHADCLRVACIELQAKGIQTLILN